MRLGNMPRWYSGSRSIELSIIWSKSDVVSAQRGHEACVDIPYSDLAVYWVVRGGRNTFVILYCLGCFFDFFDFVAG